MLKKSPKLSYCGLTIVMSNQSRFDKLELLQANGGNFFKNKCLYPAGVSLMQCEVRLKEDRSPFLPGTKAILLLGLDAYNVIVGNSAGNTLGEIRGSIYYVDGIPAIPTYLPQDAMDSVDHESMHNELLQSKDYSELIPEAAKSSKAEKRRHGITARSNWKFWLKKDTEKIIRILANDGKVPSPPFQPDYIIYPDANQIIDFLRSYKNNNLYLDTETDESFNIKCIGCSFDDSPVMVFPLFDFRYQTAYSNLPSILSCLSVSMRDNCTVSHNGANFDWIVLPWKLGLPLGKKFYDTMLAMHRCYPAVEKSLGHGTSLWTYEPFHKDEGSGAYNTLEDMIKLMRYCGKDVYTMKLIKHSIDAYAARFPGLQASIQQVNASVRAYVTMTLMGVHYKQETIEEIVKENDRLCMQYLQCIKLLVGEDIIKMFMRRYKGPLPLSNPQCVEYFHNMMGYPVVSRGKTRKDGTRHPSLAKKSMYVLRLKHDNPVIDFCIAFRECIKETGSLKFQPWLTNNGKE